MATTVSLTKVNNYDNAISLLKSRKTPAAKPRKGGKGKKAPVPEPPAEPFQASRYQKAKPKIARALFDKEKHCVFREGKMEKVIKDYAYLTLSYDKKNARIGSKARIEIAYAVEQLIDRLLLTATKLGSFRNSTLGANLKATDVIKALEIESSRRGLFLSDVGRVIDNLAHFNTPPSGEEVQPAVVEAQ
jgi:hypothetical protein